MKITLKHITTALDGGTKKLEGSDGKVYYQDFRIGTKTKGEIYDRYPKYNGRMLNKNDFIIDEVE